MSTERPITLTVNGRSFTPSVAPHRMLLDVIRNDLNLTGSKEGCSIGVCGACTVLIDGKMTSSCLKLAVEADGAEIVTIEGLADRDEMDVVQRAFVEHGASQCGICIPGQVMAARALLNETTDVDEDEVREWMVGNLCRCTGYYRIVAAVLAAADEINSSSEVRAK